MAKHTNSRWQRADNGIYLPYWYSPRTPPSQRGVTANVVQFGASNTVLFTAGNLVSFGCESTPTCSCGLCTGTCHPDLQVTIAGITEIDCGDCASANDTFVVTFTSSNAYVCWWNYYPSPLWCGGLNNHLSVYLFYSAPYYWLFCDSMDELGVPAWDFFHDFGTTQPDCNFNVSPSPWRGSYNCDVESATCSVLAL